MLDTGPDSLIIDAIDFPLRLSRNRTWEWFELTAESNTEGLDLAYVDLQDENGWTSLIRAAWAGDTKLCRHLLEAGADPNSANSNGTTPLMYAYSGRNPTGVSEVLLSHGANTEQRDFFGKNLETHHPSTIRSDS